MKKICIFTSLGGRGHVSVSNAIESFLKTDYDVNVASIFSDVLQNIDPIIILSFGKYTGENTYNAFLQKNWAWFLNLLYYIGKHYFNLRKRKTQHLIEHYLKIHRPDLIISVVPLVNEQIHNACKELDIPFILVPTDLDPRTFLLGIQTFDYQKALVSVAFNDTQILKKLKGIVSQQHYKINGFPLRKDFFTPKNINQIKEKYNVPKNKPVLMMLMGGVGTQALWDYVLACKAISFPLHIIACAGKNEKLKKDLESLAIPKNISLSVIGFTKKIADLMSVSDIFLTKSGSVSVCEGIYMNLPILLDGTGSILKWEQFNHEFIERHGFGYSIKHYQDIPTTLEKLLFKNDTELAHIKKRLQNFEKKNFEQEIKKIIRNLLKS